VREKMTTTASVTNIKGPSLEDYNELLQLLKREREQTEALQKSLEKEKNDHHFTTMLLEDETTKVKMGIEVIRRQQEEAKEGKLKLQELEDLKQYTDTLEKKLETLNLEFEETR
jgi:hypothetical protein